MEIVDTQKVDDIQAEPEIIDIARKVLEETDINVYINTPRGPKKEIYIYVERGGNVGAIQYSPVLGYSATFKIEPSREYGSGIGVWPDGVDADGRTHDVDLALEMCKGAVAPEMEHPLYDGKIFPNVGWDKYFPKELIKVIL